MPLRVHGISHVGLVHERNEDCWSVVPTEEGGLLLVVCDGMGGMGRGDEASAMALQVVTESMSTGEGYPQQRLRQALHRADLAIREKMCVGSPGLPGSTAVAVYVLDGRGTVAWVGDSRAYLVRNGALVERTRDHKLVNELVDAGQLTPEEAKASSLSHVVTRALGGRAPGETAVAVSTLGHPWKLEHGDRIVLCSDGVCDLVEDAEISDTVVDLSPRDATDRLLKLALERGGHDNITCIVATWEGDNYVEDDFSTPILTEPRAHPPNAGYFTDSEPTTSERERAEPTMDEAFQEPEPEPRAAPLWLAALVLIAAVLVLLALVL